MIAPLTSSLDSLRVAQTGRVCELVGDPAVRQRLAEMGLTVGSVVRVVRTAPLGDPMQIAVRNYHLSLRRSESRCVLVQQEWPTTNEAVTAESASGNRACSPIAEADSKAARAPLVGKWVRRLGVAALLFWGIKGLAWLGFAALLLH